MSSSSKWSWGEQIGWKAPLLHEASSAHHSFWTTFFICTFVCGLYLLRSTALYQFKLAEWNFTFTHANQNKTKPSIILTKKTRISLWREAHTVTSGHTAHSMLFSSHSISSSSGDMTSNKRHPNLQQWTFKGSASRHLAALTTRHDDKLTQTHHLGVISRHVSIII